MQACAVWASAETIADGCSPSLRNLRMAKAPNKVKGASEIKISKIRALSRDHPAQF